MEIQFNTDHNVTATEQFKTPLIALATHDIQHYLQHLTMLEIHVSDENGSKGGTNDKRCMIKAHVAALNAIAVTDNADTYELAVKGASDKLNSLLQTKLGKMNNF